MLPLGMKMMMAVMALVMALTALKHGQELKRILMAWQIRDEVTDSMVLVW